VTRLLMFLMLLGGALVFVVQAACSEMIRREYPKWAPALARSLTSLAARLDPSRADERWADLVAIQTIEGESGLYEGVQNLLGGVRVRLVDRRRAARRRTRVGHHDPRATVRLLMQSTAVMVTVMVSVVLAAALDFVRTSRADVAELLMMAGMTLVVLGQVLWARRDVRRLRARLKQVDRNAPR